MALLPRTTEEVQSVINNFGLTTLGKAKENNGIIEQINTILNDLYNELLKEEEDFYRKYGISQGGFSKFYEKIKKILDLFNKSYAFCLSGTKEYLEVKNNLFNIDYWPTKIESVINEYAKTSEFAEHMGNLTEENLGVLIGKVRKKTVNKTAHVHKATIQKKNNIWELKVEGDNVSFERIYKMVKEFLGKDQKVPPPTGFKNKVVDFLLKNCLPPEIPYREYFAYEIRGRIDQYDLFPNENSFKGFLLEVRNNAFLNVIANEFGRNILSSPVGASIKNNNGQELPIDVIFDGTNFQVKNWTINSDGKYTVSKTTSLITLLEIAEKDVGLVEAYELFFGSYIFNTEVTNEKILALFKTKPSDVNEETGLSFTSVRQSLEGEYNKTISVIPTYLEQCLDRILRIDGNLQMDKSLLFKPVFGGKDEFHNNFFMINDKIIPSSAIVKAMILSLREKDTEKKIINSSFPIKEVDETKYHFENYVYQQSASYERDGNTITKSRRDYKTFPNPLTVARQIKTSYRITLNIGEIFNIALNQV